MLVSHRFIMREVKQKKNRTNNIRIMKDETRYKELKTRNIVIYVRPIEDRDYPTLEMVNEHRYK